MFITILMAIFAVDMKKFSAYLVALYAVVALCSCDFAKNNKALVNEVGRVLVEELDQKNGEAGACDESAGAAEADDKLVMQTSPKGTPEQILRRTGYVASYNKTTLLPNWVAWHLTAERTEGNAKRSDVDFAEDTEVPERVQQTGTTIIRVTTVATCVRLPTTNGARKQWRSRFFLPTCVRRTATLTAVTGTRWRWHAANGQRNTATCI